MTPMTWSVLCLPNAQGRLDTDWLDALRALGPEDIYATPRLAEAYGLSPLPALNLKNPQKLTTLAQSIDTPTLVLRSGLQLPPYLIARMALIKDPDQWPQILAFMGNYADALNPLSGLAGAIEGEEVDGLVWNASQVQWGSIEPELEPQIEAAWLWPVTRNTPSPRPQSLAITDLGFVYDPDRPLMSSAPLSPLVEGALGIIQGNLQALINAGYRALSYVGLDDKPVTLHISHDWGGGIARWIGDVKRHDGHGHHLVLASAAPPDAKQYGHELALYADGPGHAKIQGLWLEPVIADTALTHAGYASYLDWLIKRFGVDRIIVSSLIGHSLDCLRQPVPTAEVLHDFYPASPALDVDPLKYLDEQGSLNLASLIQDHQATFKFIQTDAGHWQKLRHQWHEAIQGNDVKLIAPAAHVGQRWQALFAQSLPAIHEIPHGFECPADWTGSTTIPPRPIQPNEPLSLVCIGRLSRGKGLNRLLNIAKHFGDRVHFHVIGGGFDAMSLFGMSNIDVVLDYDQASLPKKVADARPHGALFLSRVPETWNYVLSEARCMGLRVMAPKLGSFEQRLSHGETALLYRPDTEGAIELIEQLLQGSLVWPNSDNNTNEPNMAQALEAYHEVIGSIDSDPVLSPAPSEPRRLIGHLAHTHQATIHELHKIESQTQTLHATIIDQAAWLARLDRTIKERTDWALSIDRALKDRDFELQQQRQANHELTHELSLVSETKRYLEALKAQVTAIEAERDQARRAHLDVYQQLTQLQGQYQNLDEQMAVILQSKSWRITRPLRAFVRILTALNQRKAWHPMNWSRQAKRLLHALRVHGWRTTFEALQHHRPIVTDAIGQVAPVEHPKQDETPEPIRFERQISQGDDIAISIIIPVYNNLAYTARCLGSLLAHDDQQVFEIIVIDDGSSDGTPEFLAACTGIQVITNQENLGFIGSCNAGANKAKGQYLVFLNNDTQVTEGWLQALISPFSDPQTGIVGARLVYPSGELQEAGGIIFKDGSGWNYGRLGPSNTSRVQFVCEADYVSGACLAIRKDLFDELDGFDRHYAPAYYEDTDLCFKVRALGLRVIYQPQSTVIHFEGISSGTSETSGTKRYQAINREKFKARWADTLKKHPDPVPGPQATVLIEQARHHRTKGHVLVIDAVTPQPDHDSGSVRMLAMLELMIEMGYRVSFMPINLAWAGTYSQALQDRGIEVIRHPETASPKAWLQTYGALLDWVIGSRYYVLDDVISDIKAHCPKAKIAFDTVDLHFLREQRKAELENNQDLAKAARLTERKELTLIEQSDVTLVVSPVEKGILNEMTPDAKITVLSNIHSIETNVAPYENRQGVMFVGGFQHPPNVDAARWLIDEILPELIQLEPGIELHLIGSRMPEWLQAVRAPGLKNHGFVEDITPLLHQCRVSVAPLRYGAGVKGKVNQAMAYGLPVVATSCAAEGMYVADGIDILVADDTTAFVSQILRVYRDKSLWSQLSKNGQKNVEKHFSRQAAGSVLKSMLSQTSSR